MKFDFTIISSKKIDGISIYGLNIFRNLLKKIQSSDVVLLSNDYIMPEEVEHLNINVVKNRLLHRISLGFFETDLYYSPTHHGPIFAKNKIITIHDITPLAIKSKSFKQYVYYNYFLRLSIKFSRRIITDSYFSKMKIVEAYNLKSKQNKIDVIHVGTDIDEVFPEVVLELPDKFLFMPGVHSEYKNYRRVIEALDEVNDINVKLVITSTNQDVIDYCSKFKKIKVFSRLSYSQIKYVYINSVGVIYPSLLEGFGLPALEAARLKVPVITSKNSSMEEFLGTGAAIFVDPYDIESIRKAVVKVCTHVDHEMIDIAYNNTIDLTWKNNAESILRIIKDCVHD